MHIHLSVHFPPHASLYIELRFIVLLFLFRVWIRLPLIAYVVANASTVAVLRVELRTKRTFAMREGPVCPPRRVTNRGEAKLRTVINDGVLRGSHSQSRSPRAAESCLADEGNLRSPRTKANARVCNRASAEIRAGEAGGLRRGSRDHRREGAARFAEAKNAFARSAFVSYSL